MPAPKPPTRETPNRPFEVGDKVAFATRTGTIIRYHPNSEYAIVQDDYGPRSTVLKKLLRHR